MDIGIHNRFDIVVTDAITGEVKQHVTSYNIILTALYTRLVGRLAFFSHIHFGTGTGVLNPGRTSLFTFLGEKAVVLSSRVRDFPISSVTYRIVLNPEEYVGAVISEVGIAYGSASGNLVTHSLLQDSEGNTITITKTSLDVVTIYATVFSRYAMGNNMRLTRVSTNTLVNYLTQATSAINTTTFNGAVGIINFDISNEPIWASDGNTSGSILSSEGTAITIDFDNFQGIQRVSAIALTTPAGSGNTITFPTLRFQTTQANVNVREAAIIGLFNVGLPNTQYTGTQYNNIIIGNDNVQMLPSKFIDPLSVVVTVNNTPRASTVAQFPDVFTTTTDGIPITEEQRACAATKNGQYLLIDSLPYKVRQTGKPIKVEPLTVDVPHTVPRLAVVTNNYLAAGRVAWHPNNDLYVLTNDVSPFIHTYMFTELNGGIYTNTMDINPTSRVYAACWTPNGQYLIAMTSTGLIAYQRNGNILNQVTTLFDINPSSLTIGVNDITISDNGLWLVISQWGAAALIYQWNGTQFIQQTGLPTGGTGGAANRAVTISPDSNLIIGTITASATILYHKIYRRSGTTWTFEYEHATTMGSTQDSIQPTQAVFNNASNLAIVANSNTASAARTECYSPVLFMYRNNQWFSTHLMVAYFTTSACFVGGHANCFLALPSRASNIRVLTQGIVPNTYTQVTISGSIDPLDVVRVSYFVNGIHKTDQYVLDLNATISFGGF